MTDKKDGPSSTTGPYIDLTELAFEKPIDLRTGLLDHKQLRTVTEGIAALSQFEGSTFYLDASGAEKAVWTEALYYLWGAKFDKSRESVELARGALYRMASAYGMLEPPGLSQAVQEHLGQQLRAVYSEAAAKPEFLGDSGETTAFDDTLRRIEAAHAERVRNRAVGALAAALAKVSGE